MIVDAAAPVSGLHALPENRRRGKDWVQKDQWWSDPCITRIGAFVVLWVDPMLVNCRLSIVNVW